MKRKNFPHRVKARVDRAAERQVERDKRTAEEQLDLIASRRGTSTKETTKLLKRIKHGS